LFSVINKARLVNGWTMRTAQELDPTIRVWHEALDLYSIPTTAYDELFHRALDVRQFKMRSGETVPLLDAALLISQWEGPHGLKAVYREREIKAGRTLTGYAGSHCPRCLGTGLEYRFDDAGKRIGVIAGKLCDHREDEEIETT